MTRRIRIGTRGSRLALWQAEETARLFVEAGYQPVIIKVTTTGDRRQDVPLAEVGGKGLFIKELEEALDREEIDVAAHSLKDVPSIVPERFALSAFLERGDPRDAWLHPRGVGLDTLPAGSTIGTSAPRRRSQLMERYPHVRIEPIRGNVDTRINKCLSGDFDGIVLAAAGLKRLGRAAEITTLFTVDQMVPAAGQAIVAIETRTDDMSSVEACAAINHQPTAVLAGIERGVLQRFGMLLDCYSSIAVHASHDSGTFTVRAFFSDLDGSRPIRSIHRGQDPETLVGAVYGDLVARGAMELISAGG